MGNEKYFNDNLSVWLKSDVYNRNDTIDVYNKEIQ